MSGERGAEGGVTEKLGLGMARSHHSLGHRMKLGLYSECGNRALSRRMASAFLCFKRIIQASVWLRTVVGQERKPGDQSSASCNLWVSLRLCHR